MRTSEQLDKIAAALLAFQKEVEPPTKTKENPYFKSMYADLCSLFAHCKPLMQKNGLLFTSVGLTSRLMHSSGQWIEGDFTCEMHGLSAQQVGSAMTYGRRYNFQGLLGINAEEDDDGASASKPTNQPAKKPITSPGGPLKGKPAPAPDAVGIVAAPDDEKPPLRDEDNPEGHAEGSETQAYVLEACTKERQDKQGNTNRGVLFKTLKGEELGWHQCYEIEALPLIPKLKGKTVKAKLEENDGFKVCSHIKEAS